MQSKCHNATVKNWKAKIWKYPWKKIQSVNVKMKTHIDLWKSEFELTVDCTSFSRHLSNSSEHFWIPISMVWFHCCWISASLMVSKTVSLIQFRSANSLEIVVSHSDSAYYGSRNSIILSNYWWILNWSWINGQKNASLTATNAKATKIAANKGFIFFDASGWRKEIK